MFFLSVFKCLSFANSTALKLFLKVESLNGQSNVKSYVLRTLPSWILVLLDFVGRLLPTDHVYIVHALCKNDKNCT